MPVSSAPEEQTVADHESTSHQGSSEEVEALIDRVAELEALLAAKVDAGDDAGSSGARLDPSPTAHRKPKGGPIDDNMRQKLVAKRERLELARMAEQAAWEDLKVDVRSAAEAGVSYREIGDTIGVTRARVYQIVSGKR